MPEKRKVFRSLYFHTTLGAWERKNRRVSVLYHALIKNTPPFFYSFSSRGSRSSFVLCCPIPRIDEGEYDLGHYMTSCVNGCFLLKSHVKKGAEFGRVSVCLFLDLLLNFISFSEKFSK